MGWIGSGTVHPVSVEPISTFGANTGLRRACFEAAGAHPASEELHPTTRQLRGIHLSVPYLEGRLLMPSDGPTLTKMGEAAGRQDWRYRVHAGEFGKLAGVPLSPLAIQVIERRIKVWD
ncbi:uncharacterized protein CCOS01_11314 [Colletotrichum costaricense]|uniref:Uncharacterized protein n=1 Tax=Colletotrichum costaricense TaxID=1209916 RepID=A0AAI9YRB0_9PEZI|nr:uncharacterized protein CCOS01_11314 [Colletotrichum costaricense]KAK1519663.1 hypothetical protein CCOS01_11314 [Colletotrichum costaricense]